MTEYSLDPVHLTVIYLFLVQLKRTVGGGMHSNELICVHTVYNCQCDCSDNMFADCFCLIVH